MPKFTGIPSPTPQGKTPLDVMFLNALKENVEVLTGQRGEGSLPSAAILRENVPTKDAVEQKMTRTKAGTGGVRVSDADVPTFSDYTQAVRDLQTLADDLANLRTYVIQLTRAMRG